jgi:hypothetical protein
MQILQLHGNVMKMEDINIKNAFVIVLEIIDGFVDNTSIFTNHATNHFTKITKEDGNRWSELLQASGGVLEFSKRFFYLLSWHWDTKGNPIANTIE